MFIAMYLKFFSILKLKWLLHMNAIQNICKIDQKGGKNLQFLFKVVQGYAVVEGTPVREPRLPCCGIGTGWFL